MTDVAERRADPLARAGARLRDPVVQLIASQLLVGVVALAANVMMVRALTPTHRGEVALILQVVYLASQALLLGTERSFVAAYHEVPPAAALRAYARLLALPFALGLAGAAAFAALAPDRLNPGPLVIALIASYAVVDAASLAARAVAIAAGRVGDFLACRVIEALLLLTAMAALFTARVDHPAVWLLTYLLAGAAPTIAYAFVWLRLPTIPPPTTTQDPVAPPAPTQNHNDPAPQNLIPATTAANQNGLAPTAPATDQNDPAHQNLSPAATATQNGLVPTATAADQNGMVRRQGLALFPAALSNMAMLRSDRLALPALASTAALGLYTSVATMTELLAWPLRAYADSRLGRWRTAHQEGRLRTAPIVGAAIAYVVLLSPLLAGALYLLIVPVFGMQYAAAKTVVLPLVAAAACYGVSRISLGLLVAKGHGTLVSAAEIAGFAVSFAAYLWLIPTHGIAGAAWGSLLGYGTGLAFALLTSRFAGDRIAQVTP